MKNTLTLLLLFIITVSTLKADDFSSAMLKAKKNFKTASDTYDEKALVKVRGEFERILQLKKDVWLVYYYIALIDYSIANTGMESQNKEKIKKYTESAFTMLGKSTDINPDFADSYVLKMNLHFNRWVYEQEKMNEIITGTQEADDMAKKLDPNNPRYHLSVGISKYYMPEMFGGGADKALEGLNKAYELFQTRKEKEEYYPDWGYDLTCAYIALSYMKRDKDGDLSKAKEFIDKGLVINPESGFIKGKVQKDYEEMLKDKK